MPDLKRSKICKTLAIILCLFLSFEVSYVLAYQASAELNEQFDKAKEAYFNEDYEGAKSILENLVSTIAQMEGMDSFKGETYLLLGAAYEKLEFNNLAVKYYCMAKELLGEGKTIEGLDLNTLTLYWTECQTATGVAISVLIIQYEDGHAAYCTGDYEGTKVILEKLVSVIDRLEGWESLKGETYLVLGATYEALKYKELAIKYYCKAKEILGVGVTVDCIRLSKLKWYKAKCPTGAAAAAVVVRERRGGFGGFIGTILGLGILAGLIWYLFFSKNAPFKKKEGDTITTYSSSCFRTEWSTYTETHWGANMGDVTLTPTGDPPFPNENNGWQDTKVYTLTVGPGDFQSGKFELSLKIGGGDGINRSDYGTVKVNNGPETVIIDETNVFTGNCPNTAGDIDKGVVFSFNIPGPGTYEIEIYHRVTLPTAADVAATMTSVIK